jgi:hypothetical protein
MVLKRQQLGGAARLNAKARTAGFGSNRPKEACPLAAPRFGIPNLPQITPAVDKLAPLRSSVGTLYGRIFRRI